MRTVTALPDMLRLTPANVEKAYSFLDRDEPIVAVYQCASCREVMGIAYGKDRKSVKLSPCAHLRTQGAGMFFKADAMLIMSRKA